jgi:hypothetical protein
MMEEGERLSGESDDHRPTGAAHAVDDEALRHERIRG